MSSGRPSLPPGVGRVLVTLPAPYILWFQTFRLNPSNFWLSISLSTFVLFLMGFALGRPIPIKRLLHPRSLGLGIASAALLYLIFMGGRELSKLFPFGPSGIRSVYALAGVLDPWLIGTLLVFPIAVGEEFYWRGFVQYRLSERFGPGKGFLLATLGDTTVHITSLNPMLVAAALVAGATWGYTFKRTTNLSPCLVSHAVWDLLAFLVFPLSL